MTQEKYQAVTVIRSCLFCRGVHAGHARLPKFNFSTKFPIGLHAILELQVSEGVDDILRIINTFVRVHNDYLEKIV